MMMRKWYGAAIALIAVAAMGQQARAEDGRPSRQTLQQMGLDGLAVMSDAEAGAIRGMGFRGHSYAVVFGTSSASVETHKGMADTEHAYAAGGKHFAAGGTHSKAEVKKTTVHYGHGGFSVWSQSTKVSAGGGAWAAAF